MPFGGRNGCMGDNNCDSSDRSGLRTSDSVASDRQFSGSCDTVTTSSSISGRGLTIGSCGSSVVVTSAIKEKANPSGLKHLRRKLVPIPDNLIIEKDKKSACSPEKKLGLNEKTFTTDKQNIDKNILAASSNEKNIFGSSNEKKSNEKIYPEKHYKEKTYGSIARDLTFTSLTSQHHPDKDASCSLIYQDDLEKQVSLLNRLDCHALTCHYIVFFFWTRSESFPKIIYYNSHVY